jgi:Rhodopirellula transposase DDE domain
VVPYGVYDIAANVGWVSLGITSDTAEFAVNSIRTWIERIGRTRYPNMREPTITADCGGSNGARVRLWKVELQRRSCPNSLCKDTRNNNRYVGCGLRHGVQKVVEMLRRPLPHEVRLPRGHWR